MAGTGDIDEAGVATLRVVAGPMFSGKSTRLMELAEAFRAAGRGVVAVKSSRDTRYHAERIVAHTGAWLDARAVEDPDELRTLGEAGGVVLIDEAHLLPASLHGVMVGLLGRGVSVVAAGLDRSSLGPTYSPIEVMGLLMAEADEVEKVHGVCAVCGGPATHTVRLTGDASDAPIGGAGEFEPRCRRHAVGFGGCSFSAG